MTPETPLDLIHARLEGRLTPAQAAELERHLAADPDLARLAEDYRLVHELTTEGAAPRLARTRFEDLAPHLGTPAPGLRRLATAAGVVLLAGASFLAGWVAHRETRPLELRAIELQEPPVAVALGSAATPLAWASFDPRGDQEVRFLGDLEQAESLARCAQRPLLVYGAYPGCPLAAALDEQVFRDPRVIDLAERTVPLRIDLSRLTEVEQHALTARGYPFLEMWRPDGRPTHALVRAPDPLRFVESLHDGLEQSEAVGELPGWDEIHDLAGRYEKARQDELEGRLGAAERGYRSLSDAPRTPDELLRRADEGLLRLARDARTRLFEARSAAAADAGAARDLLREACERFSGTTWSADLEAVRARLEHDGHFPDLIAFERSV